MANSDSGGWIVLAVLALGVYTCSGADRRDEDEELISNALNVSAEEASDLLDSYGNPQDAIDDYADAYREPFDEDAARDAAEEQLASESYDYSLICPLLSGPISILKLATKEEWNGKEAQAGRDHRQAA